MSGALWEPPVVEAVARHMNDDHAADSLLLVQALGAEPTATAARMSGMDPAGLVFAATVEGRQRDVRVPWLVEPADRADVRRQVVALHEHAVTKIGHLG